MLFALPFVLLLSLSSSRRPKRDLHRTHSPWRLEKRKLDNSIWQFSRERKKIFPKSRHTRIPTARSSVWHCWRLQLQSASSSNRVRLQPRSLMSIATERLIEHFCRQSLRILRRGSDWLRLPAISLVTRLVPERLGVRTKVFSVQSKSCSFVFLCASGCLASGWLANIAVESPMPLNCEGYCSIADLWLLCSPSLVNWCLDIEIRTEPPKRIPMRFDAFGTPISSENFWTFLNLFSTYWSGSRHSNLLLLFFELFDLRTFESFLFAKFETNNASGFPIVNFGDLWLSRKTSSRTTIGASN